MKTFLKVILKGLGEVSLSAVSLSANTTSAWISHQPSIPKDIEKFKKINK